MSDQQQGKPPTEEPLDVVVPRAPTADGEGMHVVRLRPRAIELAEVRPLREGRPIPSNAELVKLSPREDVPAWNVEVVMPRGEPARSGPAQVATPAYLRNWDATFGDPDDDDVN